MSLKIAKNMQFIINTNATRLIISKDQIKNTFGSFISHKDAEYNVLGNEEYERITTFNMMFITDMFRHDYFVNCFLGHYFKVIGCFLQLSDY